MKKILGHVYGALSGVAMIMIIPYRNYDTRVELLLVAIVFALWQICEQIPNAKRMKTRQTKYTGAFGATEVSLTPDAKRTITFDMKNCPHCGLHHASMDAEIAPNNRAIIRCPALGGARVEIIIKLFLNVP